MAQDGTYARLVRIQTQVTPDATVDGLVLAESQARAQSVEVESASRRGRSGTEASARDRWEAWQATAEEGIPDAASFAPRWLQPGSTRFLVDEHGSLKVSAENEIHEGVFALRALPATYPDQFISICYADADGQDHEVGMVRDLGEWPATVRHLLRQALARRYFIRRITAVEKIDCEHGLLTLRVQTEHGPAQFTMRNSHNHAQDFGETGKLLLDVDDNRFLVEDVDALPPRQQALFRRFIYW